MICPFEEDLTAYVDGELPTPRAQQLRSHLPGCTVCRATETLLRRTVTQLQAMETPEPSAALRRAVMNRLDQAPGLREWLAGVFQPQVLMPSAGLAAAVLVALVLNSVGKHSPPPFSTGPGELELAANLDVLSDFDVVGLDDPEDLEVVQHLRELEAKP